jgi:hypothetical protein
MVSLHVRTQKREISMAVQQLSVFLENKAGRIAEVLGLLGDRRVGVVGFSLADTSDYGIARLVVDRPQEARRFLRDESFTAIENAVVCVGLDDGSGNLPALVRLLAQAEFNIEYMYLTTRGAAVIKVDELERVEDLLRAEGYCVLDQSDISGG